MDKREVINNVNKFAVKVIEKYNTAEIILFGSYAKGSDNIDSDIDIAVILNDYENLLDIQLDLLRLRRKIDIRIEPHPIKKKDFNVNNPLAEEIKKFGKIINAKVA